MHLSEESLRARCGVVRVEELGPAVLSEVDPSAVVPVDRHEWPARMSELTTCRTPYESFPHGHWFLVDAEGTHWHGRDLPWTGQCLQEALDHAA